MSRTTSDPICFTCGQPAGPAPRWNRLDDGRACPSCAERLLDSLAPLVPGLRHTADTPEGVDSCDEGPDRVA